MDSCESSGFRAVSDSADDFFGGIGEMVGWNKRGQLSACPLENLPSSLDLVAFQADDHRDLEADFLAGFHERFGDEIAAGDTAENVDENAFYFGIAEDDSEGFVGRVAGDAAADVEE